MTLFHKVLYKGTSKFNGEVIVTESFGVKRLMVDGFVQSRSPGKSGRTEVYWDSFVDLIKDTFPPKGKILILGLGAGTSAHALRVRFPFAEIAGVEIDPLVVKLGEDFFETKKDGIQTFVEAADEYVTRTKTKYDLVCLDIFIGGVTDKIIQDKEFLRKLKKLLDPKGEVIFNYMYRGSDQAVEMEDSFRQSFKIENKIRSKSSSLGNLIMKGSLYE